MGAVSAQEGTAFPVVFADPEDARCFWTRDAMHWPDVASPMAADVSIVEGAAPAFERFRLPIRLRATTFNGYVYTTVVPVSHDPERLRDLASESQRVLAEQMGALAAHWDGEWLPEIRGHLEHIRGTDLASADPPGLAAHLEDAIARARRIFEIHFLIVVPAHMAVSAFVDFYQEVFPDDGPHEAHRLVQSRRHRLLDADLELWRLARAAGTDGEVRAAIAGGSPGEVLHRLQATSAGAAFLERLHTFLRDYGQRAEDLDVASPTWEEDPTPAIDRIRAFIDDPERDMEAGVRSVEASHAAALRLARERLAGHPKPVREQFEALLAMAADARYLQEEHNFWIDLATVAALHHVAAESGRRLQPAGALDHAADVFYLTVAEVTQALRAVPPADRRDLVARRKADEAAWRRLQPPPAIGTPPPGAPPGDPLSRALGRFFGTPVEPASEPGVVNGHAGAPGRVQGRARVIRSLEEARRLQPGDVLVATTTATSWTPLFATAAAVVTDTGGVMSHCATVAREYGIPAVVGTGAATRAIRDGQTVEVDGDRGTVRIVQ